MLDLGFKGLMQLWVSMVLFLFAWNAEGQSAKLKIEKLNSRINSAYYDETNPVVSRDGKTLYFTRVGYPGFNRTLLDQGHDMSASLDRVDYDKKLLLVYKQLSEETILDPTNSLFNQDIWIARSVDSEFDVLDHPDHPVNNALPNSICSLTPNPEEFAVVNEFYQDGSMYKGFSILRRMSDGSWMHPKPFHIYDLKDYGAEVNLNLSYDGEIAILSLNKKGTYGDNDLFVCQRINKEIWGAPVNMGPQLNSIFRESTPYLSNDKRTLFFASNRSGGLGGMDIYMSKRIGDSWDQWTEPQPLSAPVNSAFDDAQAFFNEASGYLYFASRRDGDSNIYRVKVADAIIAIEKEPIVEETPTIEPLQEKIITEVPVEQPIDNPAPVVQEKAPGKQVQFNCVILSTRNNKPVDGRILFGLASDATLANNVETSGGKASFSIISNQYVRILPELDGYIVKDALVHPVRLLQQGKTEEEVVFYVDPIEENAHISLNPIFFEKNTAEILPVSLVEIDRLSNILKRHPEISVLIGGHTSNEGNRSDLYILSEKRASAIKTLLEERGIQTPRLRTRGYGPSKPINSGNDDESRAQNRRVEVIITKVEK
ncbi:MAG: OmpA family protein [Saprospiraceae bacterium]|nr:OmpA family protein [Saprospiraceae bacterium]